MPIPTARRAALRRRLLAWYDAGARRLPWRFPQRGADPYRVWLAEVMLQQTQVGTVVPYYERFVARFPTLAALAAAREDEVLALFSGLGYYARGRNLHSAARVALRRHGGLPASVDALRALPGFGPYTAGAVASIAFALPAAAVDGNVTRVLARLFAVRGGAAAASRRRVEALAGELVGSPVGPAPPGRGRRPQGERSRARAPAAVFARPGDLNQALMDLGATVCTPSAPACPRCPVRSLCAARASGRPAAFPAPRRRPVRRPLVLACAVIRRGDALLLARRPEDGLFGGLWGPPWAEVAPGDDPRRALARALRRDHALRGAVRDEVAACERTLTHRALTLRAFRCEIEPPVEAGEALRWVAAGEGDLAIPAAVRVLLAAVEAGGAEVRRAPGARVR